ncbi:MAG: MFS transporter [Euryarchaeota archaeon]|nr:MFS transporter [Euryarchaeota archaeon]MBU4490898.1 MFS transporter [Euryarchaeota archaeon]MCG2727594.1 MFS transporter [Candidatus Methanoperedenaceae archaeon]
MEKDIIKGIKKNVFVLGLVSFFTDISSEMLYPIIPIFLTTVLGAPMVVVGIIEGVAESTASILKVISGWLSDKVGKRKPFVIYGYSLSAVAKPLLALAYTWHFVLFARFIDRFGKGLRSSARDALIADSTDAEYRGKAFGFHRSLDTMGAVVGPLAALMLLYYLDGQYRIIFLIAFIPALISIVLLLLFVSEKKGEKKEGIQFKLSELSREFKLFLMITIIFAIGNSSNAFLILRAKNIFENFGGIPSIVTSTFGSIGVIAVVVLTYVVYNITYSLASMPAGILSDKIGRRNVMVGGFLIFALVYLGFAMANSGYLVWLLFAVYGFYMAMTEGVSKAFVVDLVPQEKRGTAIGLYYTATGLLALLSSIIAGILWDYMGAYAPFLFGSVMAFTAAVLLMALLPKYNQMN